jgi:predicted aldo/keto reductase-like oxidoreductase
MKYRQFGNTGLKVSALGFGCMRFPIIGKDPSQIDEVKATEMIRHAIDQGMNYFDTAYPYHAEDFSRGGASEPFLARALSDGYREKVYLATKLPSWMVESRQDMDRFLDEQLERLDTDAIDFYLLHSLNRKTWDNLLRNDVVGFLNSALESGKIRYAGFSFHDEVGLFKEIVDTYDWTFCQIMYNYFDEDFQAGREGLNYAARKGLAVVAMEPLRGGALVKGLPKEAREIMHEEVPGRSEVDWAMRWLWHQPEVSVVISGMTLMEHVTENLELAANVSDEPWTEQDQRAIDGVNRVINDLQRVNCTACGYCLPCPHGVNIPRNFSFVNDHHTLNDPSARMRYHNFLSDQEKASGCVACGECVEKCPQQISIPEELEYVAELFQA